MSPLFQRYRHNKMLGLFVSIASMSCRRSVCLYHDNAGGGGAGHPSLLPRCNDRRHNAFDFRVARRRGSGNAVSTRPQRRRDRERASTSLASNVGNDGDGPSVSSDDDVSSAGGETRPPPPPPPVFFHHTAVKTRDVETAVAFYSLFDFEVETRFVTGPARAVWLRRRRRRNDDDDGTSPRLELIEVPRHLLNEEENVTRARAFDLTTDETLLGLNHLALDVTDSVRAATNDDGGNDENCRLERWMSSLNERSLERFGKSLRVALRPEQRMIGNRVYEIAFVYDADGALLELLHHQRTLDREIESGWERQ